jgi:hypothetical protein
MTNILDLQALPTGDLGLHDCPSSKSVIIIVTPFHLM